EWQTAGGGPLAQTPGQAPGQMAGQMPGVTPIGQNMLGSGVPGTGGMPAGSLPGSAMPIQGNLPPIPTEDPNAQKVAGQEERGRDSDRTAWVAAGTARAIGTCTRSSVRAGTRVAATTTTRPAGIQDTPEVRTLAGIPGLIPISRIRTIPTRIRLERREIGGGFRRPRNGSSVLCAGTWRPEPLT